MEARGYHVWHLSLALDTERIYTAVKFNYGSTPQGLFVSSRFSRYCAALGHVNPWYNEKGDVLKKGTDHNYRYKEIVSTWRNY
jgi:hypothetical protein